jgi:hypothetical protein
MRAVRELRDARAVMRPSLVVVSFVCSLFCSCAISIDRPEPPLAAIGLQDAVAQDKREIDDKTIAEAFAKKEQLAWPARLAVARLGSTTQYRWSDERALASVPASEQQLIEKRFPQGERISQVVTLSPIFSASAKPSLQQLRLEAARTHADLLLVYGVACNDDTCLNALSILDLAILPMFVVPGRSVETLAVGGMALVDVRNGFVYALAGHDDRRGGVASAAGRSGVLESLRRDGTNEVVTRMLDAVSRQLPLSAGTR